MTPSLCGATRVLAIAGSCFLLAAQSAGAQEEDAPPAGGEKDGAARTAAAGPANHPKRPQPAHYLLCSVTGTGCRAKVCKSGHRRVTDDAAKPNKVYCALDQARLAEIPEEVRLAVLRFLGRRPPLTPPPAPKKQQAKKKPVAKKTKAPARAP